jgi:hypothetical protein
MPPRIPHACKPALTHARTRVRTQAKPGREGGARRGGPLITSILPRS